MLTFSVRIECINLLCRTLITLTPPSVNQVNDSRAVSRILSRNVNDIRKDNGNIIRGEEEEKTPKRSITAHTAQIPFKMSLGRGKYEHLKEWKGSKRIDSIYYFGPRLQTETQNWLNTISII